MQTNKIYHGDCLELIKELPDACIDAVITDPPYSSQVQHNGSAAVVSDMNICKPFFKEISTEIDRVLKPDGFLYWFTDWRSYSFFYPVINDYIKIRNLLVWDKISGPGNCYTFNHELIIFCTKGAFNIGGSAIIREQAFSSGLSAKEGKKVHDTQKPIKLISKLITDCTKEGDLILDCFAGSCTTAVSAIYTKRNFICFELQEKYVEIGNKRIQEAQKLIQMPDGILLEKEKLF